MRDGGDPPRGTNVNRDASAYVCAPSARVKPFLGANHSQFQTDPWGGTGSERT